MTIVQCAATSVTIRAIKHVLLSRTARHRSPPRGSGFMALVAAVTVALTAFAPSGAHAQAANCQFDVSRDVVTQPAARTPTATLDGLLLTRFALGMRGPQLYDRLSTETNRFVGEGNIGVLNGQFDIDGDGVFGAEDAIIAARYLSGFTGDALTNGLTFNTSASRKTGAAVTTYINAGCPLPTATATAQKHAARLLQQGTYGATLTEINRVAALSSNPNTMAQLWLNEQFAKTSSFPSEPTLDYGTYAQRIIDQNKTAAFDWRCFGDNKSWGCAYAANTPVFYKFAMEGEDQLRQRVTNALWQTLVVSIANNTILDAGVTLGDYWDMISSNVFSGVTTNAAGQSVGNFRKIIKDMTLHPAMGIYLDMLGSTQEVPNENYARELLQLFSVGTVMLNQDGSVQRDGSGKTIPSYNEDVVKGFAKALTGWHYNNADSNTNEPWRFYYPIRDWRNAMKPWSLRRCPQNGRWPPGTPDSAPGTSDPATCYSYCNIENAACSFPPPHNRDAKTLLSYSGAPYSSIAANPAPNYPANQNHKDAAVRNNVIDAASADLEKVVDNVFYHPNVGPFIARQLIQRLVTSNPTPGYISRVAAKFNNNGSNIRGDMKAVITQIFLDSEARDINIAAKNWFGKMREPVNKFVHLHRAFGARETVEGFYEIWDTSGPEILGQAAMKPPSVFNYYSPDFGPSGPLAYSQIRAVSDLGARASEPLLGPEFEITNTSTIAGFSDFWGWGVYGGFRAGYSGNGQTRNLRWTTDYSRYLTAGTPLADNPQALVDDLDLLLAAGNLKPAFKANLVAMAAGITRSNITEQREQRLQAVMWQIVNSADYAIQR
jgi:uncharacterized protein (DUF1800 family)